MFVINAIKHVYVHYTRIWGEKNSSVKKLRWFYSGVSSCKGSLCNLV